MSRSQSGLVVSRSAPGLTLILISLFSVFSIVPGVGALAQNSIAALSPSTASSVIGFATAPMAIVIGLGVFFAVAIVFAIILLRKSRAFKRKNKSKGSLLSKNKKTNAALEQDFRNMFMFADREYILTQTMKERKCSRLEAMKLAVEEYERENKRFG